MKKKIVITAAITGAIHVPSMSPYLPVTKEEIIEDAVKAYEAGAAAVHIHGREEETGKPSSNINVIREIVAGIKSRCNAIVCITTGGSPFMTVEERLSAIPVLKPELASCNAGSTNFVFAGAAERIKDAKYDWEIPHLLNSKDQIFSNTFSSMEKYITTMNEHGTKPEFEVYDVGMINNLAYFYKKGLIKGPIYIQFVMGILGGIPATVDNLVYLHKTAKEQLGEFVWSVGAAGRAQLPLTTAALAMEGNVRVGLEDNLFIKPGVLAKSSAEQVVAIRTIAETLGLEIASAEEAREILKVKGIDKVGF
jgi:uncharacterized protein (DUF849 family)